MGRLDGGLGGADRADDRDREPLADRRSVQLPPRRRRLPGREHLLGDGHRRHLDHRDELDLLRRIEASARTQYVLLGAEIVTLFAFAVVALVKVYTSDPEGSIRPVPQLAQPVRHLVQQRPRDGRARRDLHLLGLGLDRQRQRGNRGRDPHPGARGDPQHDHPPRHLRRRRHRGQAFHGPKFLEDNQLDVLAALEGTCSARRSTSC